MEIRPATPAEYDAVGQVTVEAYQALEEGYDLGSYEAELRAVERHASDCEILVAVEAGLVVGAVRFVPGVGRSLTEFDDRHAAGFRMLAVAPGAQRRGIGRALTEACLDRARARGARRVVLHSTPMMAGARAMYESMGFVRAPQLDAVVTRPPYTEAEPLHLVAYVLEL